MNKRLLSVDPVARTQTWHYYDDLTDETYIEEVQDVQPFLERNNRLRNDDDYKRKGIKEDWYHVASIPNAVIMKWLREEGIDFYNEDHWPAIKRKLNSAEYSYLRTARGRI